MRDIHHFRLELPTPQKLHEGTQAILKSQALSPLHKKDKQSTLNLCGSLTTFMRTCTVG